MHWSYSGSLLETSELSTLHVLDNILGVVGESYKEESTKDSAFKEFPIQKGRRIRNE
jgi:hypothetical protein